MTVITSNLTDRVGEQLPIGRRLTIGRETACDIVLADPNVSRRHAAIEPASGGLRVVDLGSGNGVWVDGHRVDESALVAGQQFRIGATVFECLAPVPVLAAAGRCADDAPEASRPQSSASVRGQTPSGVRSSSEFSKATNGATEVTVTEGIATIGRAADSSVV